MVLCVVKCDYIIAAILFMRYTEYKSALIFPTLHIGILQIAFVKSVKLGYTHHNRSSFSIILINDTL